MRATPALPNMQKSQTLGRIFVAVSLVVFGVQHFMYGGFVAGLVPAFMPGRLFWAYFVGVAFFAAAAGILYKLMARPAATMLGVMFFLFVVLLHIPRIVGNAGNGNEYSFPLPALPTIRGMCSSTTKRKNITPSMVAAGRAISLYRIPAAAAKNATPTKYAQNKRPGINAGTSPATKPPYMKC